jgi:hypothetical protein
MARKQILVKLAMGELTVAEASRLLSMEEAAAPMDLSTSLAKEPVLVKLAMGS